MSRRTVSRRAVRVEPGERRQRPETLAAEEPLEIRLRGQAITVTMRTPGDDFDLVAGFLVSEGVLTEPEQLKALRYCGGRVVQPDGSREANTYNVVEGELAPGVAVPDSLVRAFATTSACGVCGKASIDDLAVAMHWSVADDPLRVPAATVSAWPDRLRRAQRVFERTGGIHAAGLFGPDGELVCGREDVGRHNAVDKVIGWALRQGRLPLCSHALVVSGRASFELTQKAVMAGIPMLAAVSAPSSLAVDLAADQGLTLVAFVRGQTMNIYTRPNRVT